jgi:branched-chain amino acid transport system ATP-binding protein
LLKVNDLFAFYGYFQVLKGISFDTGVREIVSIVGSNGAGKSTLLKSICGLVPKKSGSIEFLGKRIDNKNPNDIVEIGITRIPEGRKIFPSMTVVENLEVGAYSRRSRSKRNETIEKVFEFFPRLKERRRQVAGTFSGGEQQMLAIGRGLMSLPLLLMFDEPSLGLSPLMVREIFDIIKKINSEGISILLVEQDVYNSLSLAHRAFVIENGAIVHEGTGEGLLGKDYIRKAYLGL